jgi:hypothetical protein
MPSAEKNEKLLKQVREILAAVNDGQYQEVDVSAIKKEDPELGESLEILLETMNMTGQHTSMDILDLDLVMQHLSHISKTGESGVLTVLNTSETMMGDLAKLKESLEDIKRNLNDDDGAATRLDQLGEQVDVLQNNTFSVLTALEFDDINQQLMKKILDRLEEQHAHLQEILMLMNVPARTDKKESTFLQGLKHIIDLEESTRQSQEMIDEIFDDFDSFDL